jgi:hypothetical protein
MEHVRFPRDVPGGLTVISIETADDNAHADFLRGADEGARLARASVPLPPQEGGAYAVGLLYGYRSSRRAHADADSTGSAPSDHSALGAPMETSRTKDNC